MVDFPPKKRVPQFFFFYFIVLKMCVGLSFLLGSSGRGGSLGGLAVDASLLCLDLLALQNLRRACEGLLLSVKIKCGNFKHRSQ